MLGQQNLKSRMQLGLFDQLETKLHLYLVLKILEQSNSLHNFHFIKLCMDSLQVIILVS